MTGPAGGKRDSRRPWLIPALACGAATLVAVTVLNLVVDDDSGGLPRRRIGTPSPASSQPASSQPAATPGAAAPGPIELGPDGLGLVDFGQRPDDVIAVLSGRLGRPDEDRTEPCVNTVNARSRWVRWADLSVNLTSRAFVGYIEGIHFPPGRPALDFPTAKGLSPGDTADRLHHLYGPVPIRAETPQPGRSATRVFTISAGKASDPLSGVLEEQGGKTVVSTIFGGELC